MVYKRMGQRKLGTRNESLHRTFWLFLMVFMQVVSSSASRHTNHRYVLQQNRNLTPELLSTIDGALVEQASENEANIGWRQKDISDL